MTQREPEDCVVPEACPYLADKKSAWSERAKLAGFGLTLCMVIVGVFMSLQQARIDASNAAQGDQIRKEYVAKGEYDKDESRRSLDRKELKDWMERVENKIDRLQTRK